LAFVQLADIVISSFLESNASFRKVKINIAMLIRFYDGQVIDIVLMFDETSRYFEAN